MDCEEGAWSLVMACICLCPLSSVQEASCCLSRAGESRVTPRGTNSTQRGLALQPGVTLVPVSVGSAAAAGQNPALVRPSTLSCAVGACR